MSPSVGFFIHVVRSGVLVLFSVVWVWELFSVCSVVITSVVWGSVVVFLVVGLLPCISVEWLVPCCVCVGVVGLIGFGLCFVYCSCVCCCVLGFGDGG